MAWKQLITEDDFEGFAAPTAVIGGAAVPGVATTAMRSDAAPELGPLTRDLDFGGFKATNVADPAAAQDAATKAYVDAVAQGLAPKESVRAATTGDIVLSRAHASDGVAVVAGDRVLVKNQVAGAQNSIYVAAAGAWARAADADSEADLRGASVFVEEGATQPTRSSSSPRTPRSRSGRPSRLGAVLVRRGHRRGRWPLEGRQHPRRERGRIHAGDQRRRAPREGPRHHRPPRRRRERGRRRRDGLDAHPRLRLAAGLRRQRRPPLEHARPRGRRGRDGLGPRRQRERGPPAEGLHDGRPAGHRRRRPHHLPHDHLAPHGLGAAVARSEFSKRAQARAARARPPHGRAPPLRSNRRTRPSPRRRSPAASGPPVLAGAQVPQRERSRLLHDDLAEVINSHAASPETVLMALELLRHQMLAPRLRQMALG